jgi:S-layer homology domain
MKTLSASRRVLLGVVLCVLVLVGGAATAAVQNTCGVFSDVSPAICPYVLEVYYLGITSGTSATTFSPGNPMTRGQAAVFVSKTFDQVVTRSSRRAALDQWWTTTPHWDIGLGLTTVENDPEGVQCDGTDVWIANTGSQTVCRVRASDGTLLGTWTGARDASGVLVAMGRVLITGLSSPTGFLYMIDPTQPAGVVETVATGLPTSPLGIAFDGSRVWTANLDGSVSIITPSASSPWPVATLTTGFVEPAGAVFDGSNIWVTDAGAGTLLKLDTNGAVLQTVPVGTLPVAPAFDGANIWVPNSGSSSVSVVRVSTGLVLATLTGNGLTNPFTAAFDGERILVTNRATRSFAGGISLFKAADFSPLGSFAAPYDPFGVGSDGINFWISFNGTGKLGRF